MTIREIDAYLKQIPLSELQKGIDHFMVDQREGVQKLLQKYRRKQEKYNEEVQLWQLKLEFDQAFYKPGQYYVGIDEVGRGPLAGPVVAAAVILPTECMLIGLKDSKQLLEAKRETLYEEIKKVAVGIGIGIVDANKIDEINILQATFSAMRQALDNLQLKYDVIGVDGDKIIPTVEALQHAIIKGDNKSAAIAAASVIAKVTRDRMMKVYAKTYPEYQWESNKGYGSEKHYEAIHTYGITPLHRKSFLKNEGIM